MSNTSKVKAAASQVKTKITTGTKAVREAYHLQLEQECQSLGIPIPSGKRLMVSSVCCFVLGILGGVAASYIGNMLAMAAMSFTSSMFVAFVVMALTWVLAAYLVIKGSQKLGMYILTGNIDRDISKLKNKITGMFKRDALVAA